MSDWRVSAIWREQEKRYRLAGSQCPKCGDVQFPPREICPTCTTAAMLAMAEEQQSVQTAILVEIPTSVAMLADISV